MLSIINVINHNALRDVCLYYNSVVHRYYNSVYIRFITRGLSTAHGLLNEMNINAYLIQPKDQVSFVMSKQHTGC